MLPWIGMPHGGVIDPALADTLRIQAVSYPLYHPMVVTTNPKPE